MGKNAGIPFGNPLLPRSVSATPIKLISEG